MDFHVVLERIKVVDPVPEDAVIIKEEHTGVCTVTYTIHTLLVELVFTVYDSYVGSMGWGAPPRQVFRSSSTGSLV